MAIKIPGNYADGGNLYLRVRDTGAKSFILKVTVDGKQREWTIGTYGSDCHQITLSKARERRDEMMPAIRQRVEPAPKANVAVEIEAPRAIPTFGEIATDLIDQIETGFRNEKHRTQWRNTLTTYCASIWFKPVDVVATEHVLEILKPIWLTKAETASRLRGRIERVLSAAKVQGFRSGENPAAWHGHLQLLLQKRHKLQRGHHPALPFAELPNFWKRLADKDTVSAAALQFLILTAGRSGEIRGAKWDEIDFENKLWTIPAARMKAAKEHVVPLSETCISILGRMKAQRISDYVFPGTKENTPLSDMTLTKLLRGLAKSYTVHGFRSTFRDWCGEKTDFPREHAEACLAHIVGSAVERAYRRGNALEHRRRIMSGWENYILTSASPI
ncbi:tyrosine-type recombinase/integrase [Rhizobium sp. TH2]|uniref:tyrosine-type recombinase/integrase n=1 Tax=Rhizobium sp. TH2 TaxID=2775403 RepID=UPI0021586D3A|nr:site-specific integrase [Rhizobium sp. TH2]UVC10525.1 tyrosine-type recombinase/integrase [Rhizobium sp. TH2]